MAYTIDQYNVLSAAIAQGVTSVKYAIRKLLTAASKICTASAAIWKQNCSQRLYHDKTAVCRIRHRLKQITWKNHFSNAQ